MYQGRLRLFGGNKRRRRITLFFITVLALFNTYMLYPQNNDKIKLSNLDIKVEDLKKAFNPAVNKFNEKMKSINCDYLVEQYRDPEKGCDYLIFEAAKIFDEIMKEYKDYRKI